MRYLILQWSLINVEQNLMYLSFMVYFPTAMDTSVLSSKGRELYQIFLEEKKLSNWRKGLVIVLEYNA